MNAANFTSVEIEEIGLDESGCLYVKPRSSEFPYIWRAARGVSWDKDHQRLTVPEMGRGTPLFWFVILRSAVRDEFGAELAITSFTRWLNIPDEMRFEMDRAPLDFTGLKCPLPALLTKRALLRAPPDTVLEVIADDPLAHIDIPHMCRTENFDVLSSERDGDHVRLVLRRPPLP